MSHKSNQPKLFRTVLTVIGLAAIILATPGLSIQAAGDEALSPRYGRVLVVANRQSPASLELANLYCRQRNIPQTNVIKVSFDNQISMSPADFERKLLTPIRRRQENLGGAADYVVLMRGIPYRTGKIATTTAILFNGTGNLRPLHGYFKRTEPFDSSIPYFGEKLLPATVVSGYTLAETASLIERSGVRYPELRKAGTFYFCDGEGHRGSRNNQIEPAIAAMREESANAVHVKHHSIRQRKDVLGQFTGHTRLALEGNNYLPGSIVDNMTSWGGYLLESNPQMSVLTFVAHGACGAYGTVSEPTNNPARWATYLMPVRYAEGFNLIDSYLQTVQDPKYGTIVGDPLMAPFAAPAETAIEIAEVNRGEENTVAAEISIREGRESEGLLHAEVWLDDQHKVLDWTPLIPADTVCRLVVEHDSEVLLVRQATTHVPEDLPRVLAAFTERKQNEFEILPTGRRKDKLLVRWKPAEGQSGKLTCTFSLQTPEKKYSRTYTVFKRPILMQTALLDFGVIPPREGDTVIIGIADRERTARCVRNESFEHFVDRIKKYIEATAPFNEEAGFRVLHNAEKTEEGATRHQLAIIPVNPLAQDRFNLRVRIEQREGERSAFAKPLLKDEPLWQLRAVGALGEAVIQPFVPVAELQQKITIPPSLLAPGEHRLTLHTTTPRGAHARDTADIFMPAKKGDTEERLDLPRTHYDLGEKLVVGLRPGKTATGAYPLLIVDGRPVCLWQKDSLFGTFVMDTPLISPGPHEVWIEWIETEDIPGIHDPRTPVLLSKKHDIWIRRPIDAELEWSPKFAAHGKEVEVKFRGPYMRDGLVLLIDKEVIRLERMSKDSPTYTATIPPLSPGRHRVLLMGDTEIESGFQLTEPFTVENPINSDPGDFGLGL